jgi:hypothetical protein
MANKEGWTFDTLRTHLVALIEERDRLYGVRLDTLVADQITYRESHERFAATSLASIEKHIATEVQHLHDIIAQALASTELAISKKDVADEKRFEAVNEFRGQQADIIRGFLPRAEYTVEHQSMQRQIDELTKRLNLQAGRATGYSNLYGWVIGGLGLLATLITVAVVALRH